MKAVLLPAAAILAALVGVLVVREASRRAAVVDIPGASDEVTADLLDDNFPSTLLLVPVPIFLASAVTLVVMMRAATYSGAIVALLLSAIAISLVLPALTSELVLWTHRVERLSPDEEAPILAATRRMGSTAREVWVSRSPIVTFWRPALLTPALIVGPRIVVWERALHLPAARAGGFALGAPVALFWPYALWPLVAAIGFRVFDPGSLIPWWTFVVTAVIAGAPIGGDVLASRRAFAAVRSDASAADAIRGAIALGVLQARLVEGRGAGAFTRIVAAASWAATVRRAAAYAGMAGLPDGFVDAAIDEAAADRFVLTASSSATAD